MAGPNLPSELSFNNKTKSTIRASGCQWQGQIYHQSFRVSMTVPNPPSELQGVNDRAKSAIRAWVSTTGSNLPSEVEYQWQDQFNIRASEHQWQDPIYYQSFRVSTTGSNLPSVLQLSKTAPNVLFHSSILLQSNHIMYIHSRHSDYRSVRIHFQKPLWFDVLYRMLSVCQTITSPIPITQHTLPSTFHVITLEQLLFRIIMIYKSGSQ